MEEVKAVFTEKVKKHEEKLKAHKESEKILKIEREALLNKLARIDEKILVTVKGVEYHTGKLKAYEKARDLIK